MAQQWDSVRSHGQDCIRRGIEDMNWKLIKEGAGILGIEWSHVMLQRALENTGETTVEEGDTDEDNYFTDQDFDLLRHGIEDRNWPKIEEFAAKADVYCSPVMIQRSEDNHRRYRKLIADMIEGKTRYTPRINIPKFGGNTKQ